MSKKNGKVLRRYIREDGKPVGVVVATSPDNIGYSLCNIEAGDHFSKKRAVSKAVGRANSQSTCNLDFWKFIVFKHFVHSGFRLKLEDVDKFLDNKKIKIHKYDSNGGKKIEAADLKEFNVLKEIKLMEERAHKFDWSKKVYCSICQTKVEEEEMDYCDFCAEAMCDNCIEDHKCIKDQ